MLRTDIQRLIDGAENSQEASGLILAYLESEGFSLSGNGWLDDDPELAYDEDKDEDGNEYWDSLYDKQSKILQPV
jgi:hypothetical protein